MRKIEALADSIITYAGTLDPQSEGYQARNPGLLRAYTEKHAKTDKGIRVFKTWLDGYQALLFDLSIKCAGKSNRKLKLDSNLRELAKSMQLPESTARYMAKFLRKALSDDTITEDTQVSYFNEKVS